MRVNCSKMRSIYNLLTAAVVFMALCFSLAMTARASDDNSLYSLGITTEGALVDPDFSYDVWEYDVTVPAGTRQLELDPVPSSTTAEITQVEGTEIGEDGTTTVYVTVTSESGQPFTYALHVTSDAAPVPVETEPPTEKQTERVTEKPKETEPETEDTAYVKVPKDTVDQAERTIKDLQEEITTYRNTTNLYTKIIYGLIAGCVVLLFLVVNLALRGRDLKREVKEYRSLGYSSSKKSGKKGKKGKDSSSKQSPAGQPQPPAGYDPMYQSRQPAYYEKAPIDVAPQTSSRGKRAAENDPGMAAGGQMPYPQGIPAAQPQQPYPQGNHPQTAFPQENAGSQGQAPYPQGISREPQQSDPALSTKGSTDRQPADRSGQPVSEPSRDRRGINSDTSAPDPAASAGGRKRNRKDVEINMIDL